MAARDDVRQPLPRRVPSQARSRQRYEAIVDAAAVIFAEVGFEAATTEAIAARAETSIGSLYQFFPNKLALFEAMAARCLERSRAAFDLALTPEVERLPWSELLGIVIDGYAALQTADPAFRAVLVNFQLYGLFADADAELHREFISRTERMIAARATHLSRDQRAVVATMIVHVITAMLFLSQREEPAMARKMVDETKLLLARYLEPYAAPPTPARSKAATTRSPPERRRGPRRGG